MGQLRLPQGSGTYAGRASLRLAGGGESHGSGTVDWSERGELTIRFVPENVAQAFDDFFAQTNDTWSFCLESADGKFLGSSARVAAKRLRFGLDQTIELELSTHSAEFQARGAAPPRFWRTSLVNFVSALAMAPFPSRHLLRVYTAPEKAWADLEPQEHAEAFNQNRLAVFSFAGEPAFIEHYPDWEAKGENLRRGEARQLATAVMVGKFPVDSPIDAEGLKAWFPEGAVRVAGFATGSFVGVGPVELLDEAGNLSTRIHRSWRSRVFAAGNPIVLEESRPQLGPLIDCYLAASPDRQALVAMAMEHCTNAAIREGELDDSLVYLTRCLEGLAKAKMVKTERLLAALGTHAAAEVRSELKASSSRIAQISTENAAALGRIAGRVRSAADAAYSFGVIVSKLLKHYGLEDEEVMERYWALRQPGQEWKDVINKLRSEVTHNGFISLDSPVGPLDAFRLFRHLRDLAVRMVLLELGFNGEYQPTVADFEGLRPVRWVAATSQPSELGFT